MVPSCKCTILVYKRIAIKSDHVYFVACKDKIWFTQCYLLSCYAWQQYIYKMHYRLLWWNQCLFLIKIALFTWKHLWLKMQVFVYGYMLCLHKNNENVHEMPEGIFKSETPSKVETFENAANKQCKWKQNGVNADNVFYQVWSMRKVGASDGLETSYSFATFQSSEPCHCSTQSCCLSSFLSSFVAYVTMSVELCTIAIMHCVPDGLP